MPPNWATCYVQHQPNRWWSFGLYSPVPTPSRFCQHFSRLDVLRRLVFDHCEETCELPGAWFNAKALRKAELSLLGIVVRRSVRRWLDPGETSATTSAAMLARDMRENSADWLAIGRAARWRPEYATEAVAGIVRGIYADDAYDRAPVLADALDDAGCEDERVLAGLRGGEPRNVVRAVAERFLSPAEREAYDRAAGDRLTSRLLRAVDAKLFELNPERYATLLPDSRHA